MPWIAQIGVEAWVGVGVDASDGDHDGDDHCETLAEVGNLDVRRVEVVIEHVIDAGREANGSWRGASFLAGDVMMFWGNAPECNCD